MTRQTATPLVALLAATALVLAGCGQSGGSQVRPRNGMRSLGQQVAPMPQMPITPQAVERAQQVLRLAATAQSQLRTVQCDLRATIVKPEGGTNKLHNVYRYKAPGSTYLEVVQSSNPSMLGTKLNWDGKSKVKIKTKFVGFWVNVDLDVNDDRLKDDAGYKISETSLPKLYATLLHPQAQVRFLDEAPSAEGAPMARLEVISPVRLKPATHEIYGIRLSDGAPVLREMYKGQKLFYRIAMEKLQINANLPTSALSVD